MFSMTSVQPQLMVPPLATIWNTVRTTTQSIAVGRRNRPATTVSVTTRNEEPITTNEVQESVESTLSDLGLKDAQRQITVEELNPAITAPSLLHTQAPYVSAATFFENKNGFVKEELKHTHGGASHFQSFRVTLPHLKSTLHAQLIAPKLYYQSSRGFKTRRSNTATGFGQSNVSDDQFASLKLRYLKDSVFDKMGTASGTKTKQNEKLKNILQEHETNPDVQEKIKIAFAEGYVAHDKKEGEQANVWPKRILRFVWYGVIIWLALQVLQAYTNIGGNVKINVLKGERFEVNPEEITVTFADVKGVDEAKQELQDIVEFLREPEKFKALGAKLPSGVLLVGQPGIGKTLLARAVAGEAGVPFFHASGSEFDEIFVGTGAKRVRQLFDAAKMRAPCVIFIDEIDTVGAKRTSSQIHPYANQTINQLLSEMDGFQQNEGVIVLGATNRRDNLDRALLRPGRFDVEVRVFPPDMKGRKDIFDLYLKSVIVGNDVDTEKMAMGTTGCTGADLENIVNQAALKAAMDGASCISMTHMEFAKDKVLMGPAKKTRIPDEETNLNTAYHEAGHALVAWYTKDATPLHKVTIVPRGMSLGHTSFVPEKEQYNMTKSQLLAQMDVAMGGRVGEEVAYGPDKVTTGAGSDFQTATGLATAMVKSFGMSEKVGVRVFGDEDTDAGLSFVRVNDISPATSELVDSEIKRLLQESYERARCILKAHSNEHKALAEALMKYETLDVDDMKVIVSGKKLNKKLGSKPNNKPSSNTRKPDSSTSASGTTTTPL